MSHSYWLLYAGDPNSGSPALGEGSSLSRLSQLPSVERASVVDLELLILPPLPRSAALNVPEVDLVEEDSCTCS